MKVWMYPLPLQDAENLAFYFCTFSCLTQPQIRNSCSIGAEQEHKVRGSIPITKKEVLNFLAKKELILKYLRGAGETTGTGCSLQHWEIPPHLKLLSAELPHTPGSCLC